MMIRTELYGTAPMLRTPFGVARAVVTVPAGVPGIASA